MNYLQVDELAAEKGLNLPQDVSQGQAEFINRNINTLFQIMRGAKNETVRNK